MIKSESASVRIGFLKSLETDVEAMVKSIYELIYFMRGGITYHEALGMSPGERLKCMEFINERLKEQLKLPNPVF